MDSDAFLNSVREFLVEGSPLEAAQALETALIEILKSGDARRKCEAAEWLGKLPLSANAGRIALEQALTDVDSYEDVIGCRVYVAACAAGALGARREIWSVPRLCDLVRRGTPELKCAAASALGDMGAVKGAREVIPMLTESLQDDAGYLSFVDPIFPDQRQYTGVKVCAAIALARIDSEAAVPAVPILAGMLPGAGFIGGQGYRPLACELLGQIGPGAAPAASALVALLEGPTTDPMDPDLPSPEVRAAAAKALFRIGKKAEPALLDALRNPPSSERKREGFAQRVSVVLQRIQAAS